MPFDFKAEENRLLLAEGQDVLMAIEAVIGDDGGLTISWYEPSHWRAFDIDKVLADEEGRYSFRDIRGRKYTLRPLTLELYRKEVRDGLVGRPDFRSEEAMREHFLSMDQF